MAVNYIWCHPPLAIFWQLSQCLFFLPFTSLSLSLSLSLAPGDCLRLCPWQFVSSIRFLLKWLTKANKVRRLTHLTFTYNIHIPIPIPIAIHMERERERHTHTHTHSKWQLHFALSATEWLFVAPAAATPAPYCKFVILSWATSATPTYRL